MFETLSVEVRGAIGEIRLDRPEKLNPLSALTLAELARAARELDAQRDVKVVIVRGTGRAFSAGADLATFSRAREAGAAPGGAGPERSAGAAPGGAGPERSAGAAPGGAGPERLAGAAPGGAGPERSTREAADLGREMAEAIEGMRPLAIAAIHGWCVGGGLVLAAACDLRVASEDARFSIPEVDLGIPLAWGGIPRLVREIGPARTKELVLTCRPFDAKEALALGFLNRVVPAAALDATVDDLARSLAAKAGHALFSTKRHVNAVSEQMVGTARAWADADGLVTAFADEECAAARRAYLASRVERAQRSEGEG